MWLCGAKGAMYWQKELTRGIIFEVCLMKKGWRKIIRGCLFGTAIGLLIFCALARYTRLESIIEQAVREIADRRATERIALHGAARRGDSEEVRRLIAAAAEVNERDEEGKTALYKAAGSGRREVVKLLLESGADAEAVSNGGWTALMIAAWRGETGAIEELVDGGAEVDGTKEGRRPALFAAADAGREQSVLTLIEKGADVNFRNEGFPERALDAAVMRGSVRIAKVLLDNGAEVEARYAKNGMTAAHVARVLGDEKMVRLLKSYGADMEVEDDYGRSPNDMRRIMEGFKRRTLVAAREREELFDLRAIVQLPYFGSPPSGFNWIVPARMGFVIGDGSLVVTAAHCVKDMIEDSKRGVLVRPKVISRYYGDIFEAEVVAVDEDADVAILKVGWGEHPALDLASAEEVLAAQEISIAGYPRERNVKKDRDMREVFFERMPVVKVDLDGGKEAIVLGGGRYAGPGWSGSPMLCTETGKVSGVFARHVEMRFGEKVVCHDLNGCSVEAVRAVLEENGIEAQEIGPARLISGVIDGEVGFSLLLDFCEAAAKKEYVYAKLKAEGFAELRPESVNGQLLLANIIEIAVAVGNGAVAKETAERHYKRALELDERNSEVHASYGRYLSGLGEDRNAEAIAEFERALEIEGDNSFVLKNLVDMYVKTDVGKAEEYARRYVEAHGDVGEAWYRLSWVLDKQGDSEDEEIEAARKAVELDANDVPHLHRRRLADALRDTGELVEAEEQYKLMLEGHECVKCWRAYAALLEKMGEERYADAIEAIKKAEGLNRRDEKEAERLRKWRERLSGAAAR